MSFSVTDSSMTTLLPLKLKSQPAQPKQSPYLGICFMLLSVVATVFMSIQVKIAYQENAFIQSTDIIFVRALLMIPLFFIQSRVSRLPLFNIPRWAIKMLTVRAITSNVSLAMAYQSFKYVSIGLGQMIFNAHPIFQVLIAGVFLGEKASKL